MLCGSQSQAWWGLRCLTPQGGRIPNNGPLLFSTHFPSASESPPLPPLGTFWFWGRGVFPSPTAPFPPSQPSQRPAEVQAWLQPEESRPKGHQDFRRQVGGPFCRGSWAVELVTLQPPARTALKLAVAEFLLAARTSALQEQKRPQGPAGVASWGQPGCAGQEVLP